MSDKLESSFERNEMPFAAPCRHVPVYAPWYWMSEGFADLRKARRQSLSYGLIIAILTMFVVYMAAQYGSAWIMFSMLCGFVFVMPLTSIGIFAISAQLERRQPVSMKRSLRAAFGRYFGTEMVFALVLLVIFLVWARAAAVASVFLPDVADPGLGEMVAYIVAGSLVVALFLGITFSASVFALPMIMHRNVDAITAIVTSVRAVLDNKLAMLFWIVMIVTGIVIGIVTAGIGLVFFVPAVGHAFWHGYLDTIDARQFPRHEVGITAIPRIDSGGRERFRSR